MAQIKVFTIVLLVALVLSTGKVPYIYIYICFVHHDFIILSQVYVNLHVWYDDVWFMPSILGKFYS